MPLTKTGRKVKREMESHYGKKKGEQVFYAMEHSHKKWSHSPETFTSETDLPHKVEGPVYQPETSGGAEKNTNPSDVRTYSVFHNDPFDGVPSINEEAGAPADPSLNPSMPADVQTFSSDKVK